MKSVLISIQPKWCEIIASGKKTVEVRKTKPKIDTPFKCYIYCTNNKRQYLRKLGTSCEEIFITENRDVLGRTEKVKSLIGDVATFWENGGYNGKVIGEFVCDNVEMSFVGYNKKGLPSYWDILDGTCLTPNELMCYGGFKTLYGWHISDLVIYDKPKELSEFRTVDKDAIKQCKYRENVYQNPDYVNGAWLFGGYACNEGEVDWCCDCKRKPLKRPPQSWCYVEEVSQ